MLLFIVNATIINNTIVVFQYISCYCLSPWIITPTFMDTYFNTSHVTVYRKNSIYNRINVRHFNTSHVTVYHKGVAWLILLFPFQYISCYCLSRRALGSKVAENNFNTSHVTVYLTTYSVMFPSQVISIHLMLLFILSNAMVATGSVYFNTSHVTVYPVDGSLSSFSFLFQYISCYCLSLYSKACTVF